MLRQGRLIRADGASARKTYTDRESESGPKRFVVVVVVFFVGVIERIWYVSIDGRKRIVVNVM